MDELFIVAKVQCDKCGKRGLWTTVVPRATGGSRNLDDLEYEGFRICRPCIYTLQKDATVLARLEPRPPQAPAKPAKKPGKKKGKKVSAVTAGTGGEG